MRSVHRYFERHSAWKVCASATTGACSSRHALCFVRFRALMCTLLSRNVQQGARVDRYARWNALLELLAESGRVSVEDAAGRLDVSQATIRRDFDQLAQQQMITRTRGGALASGVSCAVPSRHNTDTHSAEEPELRAGAAARLAP